MVLERDEVRGADPPEETQALLEAGHEEMLAVVDLVAGDGVGERARPAAQPGALLQQGDRQAPLRQRRGAGKSGPSSADDHDSRLRLHPRSLSFIRQCDAAKARSAR